MRKMLCLIFLAVVAMFVSFGCNSPSGPQTPQKSDDIVQFKYTRDLPIVDPTGLDPKGPMMWSNEFGGINMSLWTPAGQDTWQVEQPLQYGLQLYHIWTGDGKVKVSDRGAIADTFYARIKGTQNWVKLSTSENQKVPGRWADFYLNSSGVSTPPQTN